MSNLHAFARDTALFLRCLWRVDTHGGPVAGAHSFGRGGPLSVYDEDVHACLDPLPAGVHHEQVLNVWHTALSTSFAAEPSWFHGDMAPSNLLVRDGRLAAVIDFGTCGAATLPATSSLRGPFLDDQSRRTFRQQLDVDPGTWSRGRGWALRKALLTLGNADHNATVRRDGWRYDAAQVIRNITRDNEDRGTS